MATIRSAADFGASKAGLSTVGYRLYNDDGSANGARVTAGIVAQGFGVYSKAAVTIPAGFSGFIRWDTGDSDIRYVSESYPDSIFATVMTEAYAAVGAEMTLPQFCYLIQQFLTSFAITGTAYGVKKLDQSTAAAGLVLDDASAPTAITRAS